MKCNLIIIIFVTIIHNEIYCIVPKYKPNVTLISKQRSLDDTRYRKSKEIQTPEIAEDINKLERNNKFGEIRNMLKKSQKMTIDFPSEEERKKNRLPEVNLKDLVNSKEIPNDESVEDFVDLSFEEVDSTEKGDKRNKNIYTGKFHNNREITLGSKEYRPRAKRLANAVYDDRFKPENINDVLKRLKGNRSLVKTPDKNVAKSIRKRNSNIIEEENLVTTISIFKFTGRPSRLNEHLVFKNIHP